MTEEEYLALDRAAEYRSEYYDGQMFGMSGGTRAHSKIGGNIFAELREALRGKACGPANNDLRLRIPKSRSYVYPDAMVLCGPESESAGKDDIVDSPHLIVEVLSPSTEKFDRGTKFELYKTLDSCREYMLISQDEPHVELFSRQPGGWFLYEARGLEASIRIDSLGIGIPLAGIYENGRRRTACPFTPVNKSSIVLRSTGCGRSGASSIIGSSAKRRSCIRACGIHRRLLSITRWA